MAKLGGLCLVGGLAALIAFFVTRIVPVGLVAFGAMVGGIFLLATSIHAVLTRPKDEKPARKERFESFLRSLEERMRDRYRRR
jgi:hypothetical protein